MTDFITHNRESILSQPFKIRQTLSENNFEKAADTLTEFSRVYLAGAGDSYVVAKFGEYLFLEQDIFAHGFEVSDFNRLNYDDDTLVIGVSASGRTSQVRKLIETAQVNGAYTVLLTDNPNSMIADMADEIWLTQCNLNNYDISPSCTTTTAVAYLLGIVDSISSIEFKEHLLRTIKHWESIMEWINEWSDNLSEELTKRKFVYLIGESYGYLVAQLGSMKLHEFSVCRGFALHSDEMMHHAKLIMAPNNLAIGVRYQRVEERKDWLSNTMDGLRKVLNIDLHVLGPIPYDFHIHPAVESIWHMIALQMAAFKAGIKLRPDMSGWKKPNVDAFKIYDE